MELVRLEVLMALSMKKTCYEKCCHSGQGKFSNTLEQPAASTSDVADGGSRLIWHFGKFLLELHTATTQKTASFLKETLYSKTKKSRLKIFIPDIFPYNHVLLTLFPQHQLHIPLELHQQIYYILQSRLWKRSVSALSLQWLNRNTWEVLSLVLNM
jgi:hypothetical protein